MSDSEIAILRQDLRQLSEKQDRQHQENRQDQERDREAFRQTLYAQQQTFAAAMSEQRQAFQDSINKQFIEHTKLESTVDHFTTMLEGCIGDGQPGSGRLGVVEETVEVLKKFRWQALTIVAVVMWLAELWRGHHG